MFPWTSLGHRSYLLTQGIYLSQNGQKEGCSSFHTSSTDFHTAITRVPCWSGHGSIHAACREHGQVWPYLLRWLRQPTSSRDSPSKHMLFVSYLLHCLLPLQLPWIQCPHRVLGLLWTYETWGLTSDQYQLGRIWRRMLPIFEQHIGWSCPLCRLTLGKLGSRVQSTETSVQALNARVDSQQVPTLIRFGVSWGIFHAVRLSICC